MSFSFNGLFAYLFVCVCTCNLHCDYVACLSGWYQFSGILDTLPVQSKQTNGHQAWLKSRKLIHLRPALIIHAPQDVIASWRTVLFWQGRGKADLAEMSFANVFEGRKRIFHQVLEAADVWSRVASFSWNIPARTWFPISFQGLKKLFVRSESSLCLVTSKFHLRSKSRLSYPDVRPFGCFALLLNYFPSSYSSLFHTPFSLSFPFFWCLDRPTVV